MLSAVPYRYTPRTGTNAGDVQATQPGMEKIYTRKRTHKQISTSLTVNGKQGSGLLLLLCCCVHFTDRSSDVLKTHGRPSVYTLVCDGHFSFSHNSRTRQHRNKHSKLERKKKKEIPYVVSSIPRLFFSYFYFYFVFQNYDCNIRTNIGIALLHHPAHTKSAKGWLVVNITRSGIIFLYDAHTSHYYKIRNPLVCFLVSYLISHEMEFVWCINITLAVLQLRNAI